MKSKIKKRRLFTNLIVKNVGEKGKGAFAARRFSPDEVVVVGKPTRQLKKRTNHSFQVGWDKHIDLNKPAKLLNHSCNPNCGVILNKYGGYNFVAIRTINAGEEVCWDYSTTEHLSIAVKKCLCGSKFCRHQIKGWKYLPTSFRQKYKRLGIIAPYLMQIKKSKGS